MKYIFFDVDGTLVNHDNLISDSTIQAIQSLKEQGHMVFIATGRNKAGISRQVFEIGFDGMVTSNGAYIEYQGDIIYQESIDHDVLVRFSKELEKGRANLLYSNYQACFATDPAREQFFPTVDEHDIRIKLFKEYYESTVVIEDVESLKDTCIENVDFKNYYGDLEAFVKQFSSELRILPSSIEFDDIGGSGEVMGLGVTKAEGIRRVLEHIGADREDAIAFGDGYNDFEMLDYVKVGVAMGNANEQLKQGADIVAPHINEDGIYTVLRELGLIS